MQNLRARPYDPRTGRFVGLDPFRGNMQDPQSLHKYAYVHGDPILGADPTGREFTVSGMLASITISSFLSPPDAGQLIQSVAVALVTGYAVNLEWDTEWAFDWNLPDFLFSRTDDTWVTATILDAIGGAYAQWIDDIFDPSFPSLSSASSLSDSRSFRRPAHSSSRAATTRAGGRDLGLAKRPTKYDAQGRSYQVGYYRHKSMPPGFHVVKYPKKAIKESVEVRPNIPASASDADVNAARKVDIGDANEKLGKPRDYNWQSEHGEPMTWHHNSNEGQCSLFPESYTSKRFHTTEKRCGMKLLNRNGLRKQWAYYFIQKRIFLNVSLC